MNMKGRKMEHWTYLHCLEVNRGSRSGMSDNGAIKEVFRPKPADNGSTVTKAVLVNDNWCYTEIKIQKINANHGPNHPDLLVLFLRLNVLQKLKERLRRCRSGIWLQLTAMVLSSTTLDFKVARPLRDRRNM